MRRDPVNPEIGRRALLKGALAVGGTAALAGTAGCASHRTPAAGQPATPRRGGHLRMVALGTPTTDLNPLTATAGASYLIIWQLYDQLVLLHDGKVVNSLAEFVEPNANATGWTIRIRSGAHFHNSKPVTATDVAYSLRSLGDPKRSPNYGQLFADIDTANIVVLDATTLRVPLHRARGDLVDAVLSQLSLVFPDGTTDADWAKGIGSGPFKLQSNGEGGTVLAANPDYWGGAPLLDGATFSVVADPAARLNAVRSNQADYAVDVTPSGARSVANSRDVEIRGGGPSSSIARTFEMNVGRDPFVNANVRLALKLLVDRRQLVDNILLGHGQVGNDIVGLGLPGYDTSLQQRERDVDKARSLLAAAGVSKLTITAADLVTGTVDAANLLAEQAGEAGLQLTVTQAAAGTYFNDYQGVLSTPLQAFYFINRPVASIISTYTGGNSVFNVTGVRGGSYDAQLAAAQATVDDQARRQKFNELQQYLWANGGDLVWGFAEQLDAVRRGLGGVRVVQSVPLLGTAYLP